jgi:DNA-binding SARP family transcriptional activator/TolB-like protein
MLRLRTFGGLSVERDGAPLTAAAASRRRIALLPLLAVAGEQGVSRDKVLAYLWPESDSERARNALAQTLHALRRELGEDELFVVGRELRLNVQVISSDVEEFEAAIRRGQHERAVGLYGGPFLDGFYVREAPEFEAWVETERARIEQHAKESLRAAAAKVAERGDHVRSVEYCRRLAALDPLSSQAAIGLMTALAQAGDRAAALEHARIHEGLVRQELGAAPDPAVAALTDRLRKESAATSTEKSGREFLEQATPASVRTGSDETRPLSELRPAGSRQGRRWIVAGTAALVAAVGGSIVVSSYGVRRGLDPNLVAVAPFDVLDSVHQLWREGMVDVLSRHLDGAGPLRTVSPTVVLRGWRGRADPASASALGRRTGARFVVYGSVIQTGNDSVRVAATLVDVANGRSIAEVERRNASSRMDRVAEALTVGLLSELGRERPIRAVRASAIGSASLPALKAFLRGEQYYRQSKWDSARVAYDEAVALDTTFALALHRIGTVLDWYSVESYDTLAISYLRRAARFNRGLAPRDSLMITADSLKPAAPLMVRDTADLSRLRRRLAAFAAITRWYPGDPEAWYAYGHDIYHFGEWLGVTRRRALDAFDRAIELDSTFVPAYIHPVELALNLRGPAEARRYAHAYLALAPGGAQAAGTALAIKILDRDPGLPPLERLGDTLPADPLFEAYVVLQRWPDSAAAALKLRRALFASAESRGLDRRVMLYGHVGQLLYRGQIHEAVRVVGDAFIPGTGKASGGLTFHYFELAQLGVLRGPGVEQDFAAWLHGPLPVGVVLPLPWWAARGDTVSLAVVAERSDSIARSRPAAAGAALMGPYGARAARAYLALVRRDSADAVRQFASLPDSLCRFCAYDRLTKARLFARRGRARDAAALLDEGPPAQESFGPRPVEVLWELERGRVHEQLGHSQEAARHYRFAADLWAHADPELHPYRAEANAGLARLKKRR